MAKTAPGSCGGQDGAAATTIGLPPIVFYVAWVLSIGAHVACMIHLVAVAAAYLNLELKENEFYVLLWSDTGSKHFKGFAAVYLILTALHVLQILHIVYLSIRNKRLVLHSERSKTSGCNDESKKSSLGKIWCFDVVFAAREMMAVGCLSYQAYQSSYLVPRVWLNNLNVAILIVACWLTPIVQILLRKSIALGRVMSLLSSFILCTFLGKAVHGILFNSYSKIFMMDSAEFGDKMVFDPTFVSILVPENRMMFATTVGDYVSKLLPHISSLTTLIIMEGFITRRSDKVTPSTSGANAVANVNTNQNVTVETLDIPSENEEVVNTEPVNLEAGGETKAVAECRTAENTTPTKNPGSAWPFVVVKFLFIAWGAIVLAFHVKAQSGHKTAPLGCFSMTHPWFSSNVSCLGLVYDCAIQGKTSPTNELLDAMELDSKALGSLSFVHCPALVVPSAIQRYPNIYNVHVFNSTLYSWGSSAALVEDHHHRLISVALIYTMLAAFPEGLMGKLPQTMVNLEFFATSLPTVPSDLGTKWGVGRNPIGRVGFEYGMLSVVPPEIFQLPVSTLSLAGNYLYLLPQLASVPANTYLPQLVLDGNPMLMLPPTVDPTLTIGSLFMEGTKLLTLPSWTKTQVKSQMYLFGSAFCSATTPAQQEASNAICSVSHWGLHCQRRQSSVCKTYTGKKRRLVNHNSSRVSGKCRCHADKRKYIQ